MAEKVVIGNAELWHGDCREVLPLLPPVDLVLTDPPYGIGAARGSHSNLKMDDEAWDDATPPDWLFGLMREKGRQLIVWGGNYFNLPPTRGFLFWDKSPMPPSYAVGEMAWTSIDMNAAKWCGKVGDDVPVKDRDHPTQKPVRLLEWCISKAEDVATVCDPFMGSGTTGVACARMGLQFVGIERERKYFDIAVRRIEQAYAQPRLFEDAKVGAGETAVQGDMLLPANVLLTGAVRRPVE